MTPTTRIVLAIFGAGGLLFSLPCMIAMGSYVLNGNVNSGVAIVVFFAMMVLAIPSAFAVYSAMKSPPLSATQTQEGIERLILQIARIHHGRVSATQVATATPLSIEQVTHALQQLEQNGRIYSVLTINDGTEFIFPDLLPPTTELEQFEEEFAEQNQILDLDFSQQESEEPHQSQSTNNTNDRS